MQTAIKLNAMKNENFNQPFYVGLNNPRFPTARSGYLPALEPKEVSLDADKVEPEWSKRQWGIVQQLKAQVLFLSNKINEMRANASKRKGNSKYD